MLIVLGGLTFLGLASFRVGPAPVISIQPDLPGIGKRTAIRILVEEPVRGLTGFAVELRQGERVERLDERTFSPRGPWELFWGERIVGEELIIEVGSETLPQLEEGEATIRVAARRAPAWLRRPEPVVEETTLPVRLRPPAVQVLSTRTYVAQGGSEAVVYRVGPTSIRDGVQAGDWWFPGFPLPGGGERDRFALFAVPYDLDDHQQVTLVAADDVGNQGTAAFIDRFFAKPPKSDTIRLSESFMARVVPAIMDQTPGLRDTGNLLDDYLMINGELRETNARTLVELGRTSTPDFLWSATFQQMRNAKVMSAFADRRSYVFQGRAVDQQDHLGFDLASTAMAEIPAANDGVVVLARFFGIYGNAVVIDHGYGLQSLYGHLSSLSVEEGQTVERGQTIGRSGATGLAGGDHLHFTMLLHGLPVNPQEWWDAHWLHDRLKLKLGASLPFER